jgi:hypothetical protein
VDNVCGRNKGGRLSRALGDLRTLISAIRIVSQDSLGIPLPRQCPRGYFSAAIGELARNVFSRKVLHLDGLSCCK